MLHTKAAKRIEIVPGRRVEHSEHEGRGIVRHGDLDLWNTCAYRQPPDQFTQWIDKIVNGRGKHLAAMHVGDERR